MLLRYISSKFEFFTRHSKFVTLFEEALKNLKLAHISIPLREETLFWLRLSINIDLPICPKEEARVVSLLQQRFKALKVR